MVNVLALSAVDQIADLRPRPVKPKLVCTDSPQSTHYSRVKAKICWFFCELNIYFREGFIFAIFARTINSSK